jgi:hypothetical protein
MVVLRYFFTKKVYTFLPNQLNIKYLKAVQVSYVKKIVYNIEYKLYICI